MDLSDAKDLAVGPSHHIYALAKPETYSGATVYRYIHGKWSVVNSNPAKRIAVGFKGKLFITTSDKIFMTSSLLSVSRLEAKQHILQC